MTFDIILVSNAKGRGKLFTENAIKSILLSKNQINFNIIVVEQIKGITYKNATTINYDFKFNYNKCLNLGISKTKNKYIVLCNNDLQFHPLWAENLYRGFKAGFISLSPYCKRTLGKKDIGNHILQGYQIARHVAGWCIAIDRGIFKKIGKINDDVEFWYSDNIYADQLIKAKIKHGLICNSFVTHTNGGSNTLNVQPKEKNLDLTGNQLKKYNKAKRKVNYAKKKTIYSDDGGDL